MPYHSAYFRARASRSRFAPQVIAYWLMSSRMARAAASFSASGAGKFGNPCARLIAPCSLASRVMPRITESVKPCVRRGVCMAGGLLQKLLRDGIQLHVARSLVNRPDLRVAVELLDGVFLGVPVTAEQLHGERRHPLGDLRGEELGHGRLHRIRLARVLEARGVVDHQARRLQLRRGLGELELHRLELGDRMSELVALLHVPERRSERPPRYADHLSADADAAGVEGLDRHLVAFAHLSHYAGRGQLAAVEDQFARARRADAELVFLLADREPA